jgi:hypothetical protein
MTGEGDEPPDPVIAACLARTRALVLKVLIASIAIVVIGGAGLRTVDQGATLWPEIFATRVAHGLLFGIIFLSYFCRRALASRSSLRDPLTRFERFHRAHLVGALIGALAVPLGLVIGYAVRPRMDVVGPFWVAALALESLALPRGYELSDFDQPMVLPAEYTETHS